MTLQTSNNSSQIIHKRLSVQVSLFGLSFLVTDAHTGAPLFFEDKKQELAQTPESLLHHLQRSLKGPLDPSGFDEVTVLYANNEYTVVPASLFDETKASDYLKFNNRMLSNDFVAFDQLSKSDLCVVYIPLVNINNYLFDTFGSFKYFHSVTVLLDKLQSHSSLKDESQVQIHILENHFDLIAWRKDRLLMCNSFNFTTPEDFIYYVLFSFEQLSLDPDQVAVTLMGAIDEDDEIYHMAYRYIRNISFLKKEAHYPALDGINAHDLPCLKLL